MRSVDYIGHQISGDVRGNIRQVLAISRQLQNDRADVLPFTPYLSFLLYLRDDVQHEREYGMQGDAHLIDVAADRLRIHGPRLSTGLMFESKHFRKLGRPIILQNPALAPELENVLEGYPYTIEPFMLRQETLLEVDTLLAGLRL